MNVSSRSLKMAINARHGGLFGDLTPKYGAISSRSPKGTSLRRNTSYEYRLLRSVHPFLHSSSFYPTLKILCFTMLFSRAAVGTEFQSPYPSHTHRKTRGNPHRIPVPTEPQNPPYPVSLDIWVSIFMLYTQRCYYLHSVMWRKMQVKQIKNWTVFGEVQTSTTTFVACLTRFRLISHPFKNPHRILTDPWGFITVSIPIPYPYPWEFPWESPYSRQPCFQWARYLSKLPRPL